ncbi:MAG: hypothetical protein LBR16_04555 [Treponema sp.]|jgi:chromosome segregation ATPase|nr:hypothetical protein [Treponema sp.]
MAHVKNEIHPEQDANALSWLTEQEKRDIRARIDGIAASTRGAAGKAGLSPAAGRRGILFPFLVNAGALVFIAGGILFLSFLHIKDETAVRESASTLGITERALIREIRRESAVEVRAKEDEIEAMLVKLASVDAELQDAQNAAERGSAAAGEQHRRTLARLRDIQAEYRGSLSVLQGEKTRLLEDARAKEEALRAQATARTASLAAESAESGSAAAAQEQLARISGEQERIGTAEAQLTALYTAIKNDISAGSFAAAGSGIDSARALLEAPSLAGLRPWERVKKTHAAALSSLAATLKAAEDAAAEAEAAAAGRPSPAAVAEAAALKEQIALLEQQSEERARSADKAQAAAAAAASRGENLEQRAARLESRVRELETAAAANQRTISARDASIAELRTQAAELRAQNERSAAQVTDLRTQAAERDKTLAERDASLSQLREQNAGLNTRIGDMQKQIDAIKQLIQE